MPCVKAGDRVVAGQRVGLIRFGSRVDVYLPAGTAPQVLLGQRTIAGETIVARARRLRADRGRRAVSTPVTRGAARRAARGIPLARRRAQCGHRAGALRRADRRALRDRRRMGEGAIVMIIAAGVLDGMDGRIARVLRGQSRFGAELDSLSDVIAFGVSPAMILYLWSLQALAALRLAVRARLCRLLRAAAGALQRPDRRRASSRTNRPGFLTGVPAPAGAGLLLLPMFLWLASDRQWAWLQDYRAGRALGRVRRLPDDFERRDLLLGIAAAAPACPA